MSGIWIYSEDNSIARQLISAGLNLKGTLNQPVGVITLSAEEAQGLVAAGVDKVVVVKGNQKSPEGYSTTIGNYLANEEVSVFLVGATARGKDVAAKIAARLKTGLVTEAQTVTCVDGHIETTRLMYGGLAVARESVTLPAIVTIPARIFEEPAADNSKQGEIITLEAEAADLRVTVNEISPIVREGADITAASRIVCVGRGLGKKEDLAFVEDLAQTLGGEVACSRGIAEDYHWLPVERYIGISGQKVKPELYLSLGISGQVQHLAGMRDSRIVVAIDRNEKAPIFEAADYGIVGDLYEVAPLLTKALQK